MSLSFTGSPLNRWEYLLRKDWVSKRTACLLMKSSWCSRSLDLWVSLELRLRSDLRGWPIVIGPNWVKRKLTTKRWTKKVALKFRQAFTLGGNSLNYHHRRLLLRRLLPHTTLNYGLKWQILYSTFFWTYRTSKIWLYTYKSCCFKYNQLPRRSSFAFRKNETSSDILMFLNELVFVGPQKTNLAGFIIVQI